MSYTIEEYIQLIQQWAVDRNILEKIYGGNICYMDFSGGTLIGQARKLLEEASEVLEAAAIAEATSSWDMFGEKLIDGLGDTFVVLCVIAGGLNIDLRNEAIPKAWNEIKDRKGKMINGKFVKEADLREVKDTSDTRIDRMQQELKDLDAKLTKLNAFISFENDLEFSKLSEEEQKDLLCQQAAMQRYLDTLRDRYNRAMKAAGLAPETTSGE